MTKINDKRRYSWHQVPRAYVIDTLLDGKCGILVVRAADWWMSRRLGFLVCVVTKRLVTVWPKLVFVEKRNGKEELFGDWSVGCWRVF